MACERSPQISIFVPQSFYPPDLDLKHPSDLETYVRRRSLEKAAYSAGGKKVKLDIDLLREARTWAKEVHGSAMVRKLLTVSGTLKHGDFYKPEEGGAMKLQRHGAVPALMAAATAIEAAKTLQNRERQIAVAVTFPPGHHAGEKMKGYCFLNNLVIALRYYEKTFLTEGLNIAILDLDAHRGDGTNDLTRELPNYYYFSLCFQGIYELPNAGDIPEKNYEERAHFANLLPGISKSEYLAVLETYLDQIGQLKPAILGISLGFDTDERDLLTGSELGRSISELNTEAYQTIGTILAKRTKNWPTKILICFEGGYSPLVVFQDAYAFLVGLLS